MKNIFNSIWGFDFKVGISKHIVNLQPGKQISIPVTLEKIRGNPQTVDLDVNTSWESVGLSAKILPSSLEPSQPWEATMMIRASAQTPPGSYLFTVRGGVKGTFHTSEDAVTVIVDPKAEQKSDEEDNVQSKQATTAVEPSPSFSLDKLFTPKSDGASGKLSSAESEKIKKQMSIGSGVGLTIGFIIIAIIMGIVLSNNIDGGITRRCIIGVLVNHPDCSDNNGQPEHTLLNGHDLGVCRVVSNSGCVQR